MPLILPSDLPAAKVLHNENIFVMNRQRAVTQDIRPLDILIVNLMPDKISAETQLARLLANTPLQVQLTLLRTGTHQSTHTPQNHLAAFYTTLDEIRHRKFDGMIITGAPVEHLDYNEVDYWPEFASVIEFSKTNVYSTIYLCWAMMAGLHYNYGIPKVEFGEKLHGVFTHKVERPTNPLVRGFDEYFRAPHSRHAGVERAAVEKEPRLRILADSEEAGLHILSTENGREIYVMGHMEYDKETLYEEYRRDRDKGMNPKLPRHYFIDDDPEKDILFNWRSHGHIFYTNWLNYYVYQGTPFNLDEL